jgi:hypothetical protein
MSPRTCLVCTARPPRKCRQCRRCNIRPRSALGETFDDNIWMARGEFCPRFSLFKKAETTRGVT